MATLYGRESGAQKAGPENACGVEQNDAVGRIRTYARKPYLIRWGPPRHMRSVEANSSQTP